MSGNSETDLKERVAQACRVLGTLDLTQSTVGHCSARVPGADRFCIRARGPAENGVRYTTKADVIEVGLDARRINAEDDGYSTPLEVHIHTEIYKRRPDVNAVVHMHPPKVMLLSICDVPLRPIYGAYDPLSLRLVLKGVPVFPKSLLISDPEIGAEFAETMAGATACLMTGHGLTTAANSVEEAALAALQLNEMASLTYEARLLGGASEIPEAEQAVFRDMEVDRGYGSFEPGVPTGRAANLWRYFLRRAEELAGGDA